MLMKRLTNFQVSLVAAVLLTNSLASPVMAQTGNQSDITGPILSTSDFAGQTLPITTTVTVTGFQGGEPAQISVNQAAVSVNTQLADNNLTSPTGTPIPAPIQQTLLSIVTGDAQAGNNINAFIAALSTVPGAPIDLIQDLLDSLNGLTSDNTVNPVNLLAAVQAYNAMILASNEAFLS
ncbi:MAG: hypothetical protein ACKN9A_20615, partial [Microcystis aeruginosa]